MDGFKPTFARPDKTLHECLRLSFFVRGTTSRDDFTGINSGEFENVLANICFDSA
jgi:hypothetical protein